MKKEIISKKTLEYLAGLARIELKPEKEEKLLKDLGKILGHFEELEKVDTENIEPMAGGTIQTNVFREDDARVGKNQKLVEVFPEKEGDFLKVPAVFKINE